MRRLLFFITLVICLCICAAGLAQELGWYAGDNGETYYFGGDGTMQIWSAAKMPAKLIADYRCASEYDDGAYTLTPFTAPEYYSVKLSEDKAWLSIYDRNGEESSWLNSTPAEPSNAALKKCEDNPFVGIWTCMTDDLTAPALELYDDGCYGSEDLLKLGDTETSFGMYLYENGLLTLFTKDTGMTLSLAPDGEGFLLNGDTRLTPVESSDICPTAQGFTGEWKTADDRAFEFFADGSYQIFSKGKLEASGIWSISGGRITLNTDEPFAALAMYVAYGSADKNSILLTGERFLPDTESSEATVLIRK